MSDAPPRLRKELGLFDVYSVATGATLSTGFFLLPGLAAATVGPAVPLPYVLAALLVFPGIVSKIELSTAMPRAGGAYYFVDRSLGPLMGTIGGFGTWIALTLKTAFALIGVGAYLRLFLPAVDVVPIASAAAVLFGVVNILGVKKSGSFQSVLVVGLLALIAWFLLQGALRVDPALLEGMFSAETASLVSATGLVVVAYVGLTKVASIAEEVRDPERNLPLGVFLGLATAVALYVAGTTVMVGVAGHARLAAEGALTPAAFVADLLVGQPGVLVMTVAAVLAFSSAGQAGILSASRYPLAMGRDGVLPPAFRTVGRFGTPTMAIVVTVVAIVVTMALFDATKIAKLAGAFQLVMFALSCVAVVVMRESGIASYDPGYRSPFYPWLHVVGTLAPFWLIVEEGWLSTLFTGGLILFGALWYTYYARRHADREGAILHVFERLGRQRDPGLDRELREILKEKGLRDADPFEQVVATASVIDAPPGSDFREIVWQAAAHLAEVAPISARELGEGFLQGTLVGMTPVSHGAALPHLRIPGLDGSRMVLVRAREGIEMNVDVGGRSRTEQEPVRAVFFLLSPEADPGLHLRLLAELARRIDHESFMHEWLGAEDEQRLKEVLLRDERLLSLDINPQGPTGEFAGRAVRDLDLPDGTLLALVRRGERVLVPRGDTRLEAGDRLTLIGEPPDIELLRERYLR
ncbi:MAG: amino acid permease [Gemmatimonadetes bacterium]|nr:MAG: amino acid permease [Gemmatimonadota bacterium]